MGRLLRLRRAVEIWLADAGIGGNVKSSSLRGFDAGPMLEFADRENLLGNTIVFTHTSAATCQSEYNFEQSSDRSAVLCADGL